MKKLRWILWLFWFFQHSNCDSLLFLLYLSYSFGRVKNVHVIRYSIREILDQKNVFFFWEMWFNYFVQILSLFLSFLPSAVILSVQNAHSDIYRSYTFCHLFFYHYGSSKFSTEVVFFRGKSAIWENGNNYWKVLVSLKQTGAALAVVLAWTCQETNLCDL